MIYRNIAGTEVEVSAIGLGCGTLGSLAGGLDARRGVRLVEQAFELGVNFFDTANVYGQGDSERILGRALKGKRDRVVLVTKAGYRFRHLGVLARAAKPFVGKLVARFKASHGALHRARAAAGSQDFSPAYLTRCLDESLRRLNTDYVDFFMLHSLPSEQLGNPQLFEHLASLRAAGKVRHYGFSMMRFDTAVAERLPPGVEAVGTAVNPLESENLRQLPELARRPGVMILAYEPFASGKLFRTAGDGAEGTGAHEARARAISEAAREHGLTPAQIILHHILGQPGVLGVFPRVSKQEHLRQNVEALRGGRLIEPKGTLALG